MMQAQIIIDLTNITSQPIQTPLREGEVKNKSRKNTDKDNFSLSSLILIVSFSSCQWHLTRASTVSLIVTKLRTLTRFHPPPLRKDRVLRLLLAVRVFEGEKSQNLSL